MATPYNKIWVNNDDQSELTGYIESMSFEDAVLEDSFLNLTMAVPADMNIADTPYLTNGTELYFIFGYLDGAYSPRHLVRIVDITYKYGARITLSIKCLDKGSVVKKNSDRKVWKGKTTIQIITEILQGYGMEFEYDEYRGGHKKWDSIPQGNKSDFDFIRYLVSREVSGNYLFYVKNNRGYLVQRAHEEKSTAAYVYGDGTGTVLSFEPSLKESTQTGAGNSSGVAATFGDGSSATVKDDKEPDNKFYYDANAKDVTAQLKKEYKDIGTPEQKERIKETVGKVVNSAVADKTEAANLSNYNKTKENAKILTAKLKVEGDPTITSNTVINMQGVYKPHQGAWLVTKVTHEINASGYVTTMDMDKGYKTNKTTGKKKSKSGSKEEAPDAGPIIAYDANANEVIVDKLDYTRKIIGKN